MVDVVKKVAKSYGAQGTAIRGHGDFIGSSSGDGSDAEQRADALKVYEATIAEAAAARGLAG
jgi:hypothetical protein